MKGGDDELRGAACPRCGYDLSGAIAAWERNEPACCPLEGVCSECGLGFWCRDVLNPVYSRQERFFEHAQRRLGASLAVTVARALRPGVFWTWIRLEHRVRVMRMVAAAVAGAAASYAAGVAALLAVVMAARFAAADVSPWFSFYRDWTGVVLAVAWPFSAWDPMWQGFEPGILPLPGIGLLATALLPLTYGLLPVTLRRAKVRRAHLLRVWAYGLIGLPLALLAPTAASVGLEAASRGLGLVNPRNGYAWGEWWLNDHRWILLLGCVLCWDYLWWSAAARLYLRLPAARGVALATLVLAVLLAVAAVMMVPGGTMWLTRDW